MANDTGTGMTSNLTDGPIKPPSLPPFRVSISLSYKDVDFDCHQFAVDWTSSEGGTLRLKTYSETTQSGWDLNIPLKEAGAPSEIFVDNSSTGLSLSDNLDMSTMASTLRSGVGIFISALQASVKELEQTRWFIGTEIKFLMNADLGKGYNFLYFLSEKGEGQVRWCYWDNKSNSPVSLVLSIVEGVAQEDELNPDWSNMKLDQLVCCVLNKYLEVMLD